MIFFWNYRLEKAGLLKWRKSLVSEHLRTVNMLKGPKHCINLQGSIFLMFFDQSEKKISSKNFFLVVYEILTLLVNILTPDDKYSLSVKAGVSRNQFKRYYLKIKIYLVNFFLHFQNLHKICNILKEKVSLRSHFFSEITDCKKRGYLNAQKAQYRNTYTQ